MAVDERDAGDDFLPTRERAKRGVVSLGPRAISPELLESNAIREERLAAILLVARVLRRETWEEEIDTSARAMSTMATEAPAIPDDFVERSMTIRVASSVEETPCTLCDIRRPGFNACRTCIGSGKTWATYHKLPALAEHCTACESGYVRCSACEGTRRTVRVRVRHMSDRDVSLRDVFIPAALGRIPKLFGVETAISDVVNTIWAPPATLRFDLLNQETSSAYRGAQRRIDPSYRGHEFADALGRARAALRGMARGGIVMRYVFDAYACPLLWLHSASDSGGEHAALFVRPDGALCAFCSA